MKRLLIAGFALTMLASCGNNSSSSGEKKDTAAATAGNDLSNNPVYPAQMFSYGLSTFEIGGNILGGTSSGASFNGLLGEVQVYWRALSPAEILGLYAP